MKKLTAILILIFAFRVGFYYAWSGKHTDVYFTQMNHIREAVQWIGYGAMCSFLFNFCKEKYCGLALYVFMIFSYSFSFMCLKEFMPIKVDMFMEWLMPVFFKVWSIIAIITAGYYLLTFRIKTA